MTQETISLKVCISSVDGETFFTMGTGEANKGSLLQFLQKHDHEGASVSLEVWKRNARIHTIDDATDVYAILAGREGGE